MSNDNPFPKSRALLAGAIAKVEAEIASDTWLMRVTIEPPSGGRFSHITSLIMGAIPMMFLAAYDPDHRGGIGNIILTGDPAKAKTFGSAAEVLECWKTQSTVRPWRADGKPNRPLTAHTIQPIRFSDIAASKPKE